MTAPLHYITASEALERFRSRELSPVELLDALIERAGEVEPTVNAFVFEYFDEAREAARAAEDAYARGEARALEGIPITVKDEMMIAGKPTPNASFWQKDFVPEKTDVQIQRLIDAGAVIHSRSAAPEFSFALVTWSKMFGVTRNPWATDFAVGGSSGGSGCSLASGTTTLAVGSDIGGSIRIPASMNGVMSIKPFYGRMPESAPWNRDCFASGGPMGRSVEDVIRMYNVMSGHHPSDITSLPKVEFPLEYESIEGRRVGFCMNLGYFEVDAEIQKLMRDTLGRLEAAGAVIEEVELDWPADTRTHCWNHLIYQAGFLLRQSFPDADPEELTPYMRDFFSHVGEVGLADEFAQWFHADAMYQELYDKVFERCDVFLCPTVATNAIAADFDHSQDEVFINGEKVDFLNAVMTYPFNMLNRCPVFAMPMGRTPNGVPAGFQIVGPAFRDDLVFQYASAFAKALGPIFVGDDVPSFQPA